MASTGRSVCSRSIRAASRRWPSSHCPVAVDLPGLGRSGGELTLETGTVPALADWVARFAYALKLSGPVAVAGHDIGGAVAQHLLVHDRLEVSRLALVNSVTYGSWPVSSVARFRDPEDDGFQKVEYDERFASEIPHTTLIRIPGAGHMPTENAPGQVAHALIDFFTA